MLTPLDIYQRVWDKPINAFVLMTTINQQTATLKNARVLSIDLAEGVLQIRMSESLTARKQLTMDAVVAAHTGGTTDIAESHIVQRFDTRNRLSSQTWYEQKIGTGQYAVKAREILYTYSGAANVLVSNTENTFDRAGNTETTVTRRYFMQGTTQIVETS